MHREDSTPRAGGSERPCSEIVHVALRGFGRLAGLGRDGEDLGEHLLRSLLSIIQPIELRCITTQHHPGQHERSSRVISTSFTIPVNAGQGLASGGRRHVSDFLPVNLWSARKQVCANSTFSGYHSSQSRNTALKARGESINPVLKIGVYVGFAQEEREVTLVYGPAPHAIAQNSSFAEMVVQHRIQKTGVCSRQVKVAAQPARYECELPSQPAASRAMA